MLQLYKRLIGARIRGQMQYRASFWADLFGFALMTSLDFVVLVILVSRFGGVAGWTLPEITLLYGIAAISFGTIEMVLRGFDFPFEQLITNGAFDTLLLRPHGLFFQVLASEFQLRRLGRVAQGLVALSYGLLNAPIIWRADKLLLLPLAYVSGCLIYGALIVIGATICFWTIRSPEIINAFTYGGLELTNYPLSIYSQTLRAFVLFVIPIGFTSYPAVLWLLDRTDPHGLPSWLAWCAPLVGIAFFALALRFWRTGVQRYQSTGT